MKIRLNRQVRLKLLPKFTFACSSAFFFLPQNNQRKHNFLFEKYSTPNEKQVRHTQTKLNNSPKIINDS